MMVKYETVYPYGLNVKFYQINIIRSFREKVLDVSLYEGTKHIFNYEKTKNYSKNIDLKNLKCCWDIENLIDNYNCNDNEIVLKYNI